MAFGRGAARSERRKRDRTPFKGAVILCWTDDRGRDNYGGGRCTNISAHGCSIESKEAVPLRTIVSLRIPDLDVSAFASVRHVVQKGMKFNIGLEFGQPVALPFTNGELAEKLER
jgi:hypothetical protein